MKTIPDIAAAVRRLVAAAPSDATLVEDLQREVGLELLGDQRRKLYDLGQRYEAKVEDLEYQVEELRSSLVAERDRRRKNDSDLVAERKRSVELSNERHRLRFRCEEKDAALQQLLDVAGYPELAERLILARAAARAAVAEVSAPGTVSVASLSLEVRVMGVGILGDDEKSFIEVQLGTGRTVALPAPMDDCSRAGKFLLRRVTAEVLLVAPAETKEGATT